MDAATCGSAPPGRRSSSRPPSDARPRPWPRKPAGDRHRHATNLSARNRRERDAQLYRLSDSTQGQLPASADAPCVVRQPVPAPRRWLAHSTPWRLCRCLRPRGCRTRVPRLSLSAAEALCTTPQRLPARCGPPAGCACQQPIVSRRLPGSWRASAQLSPERDQPRCIDSLCLSGSAACLRLQIGVRAASGSPYSGGCSLSRSRPLGTERPPEAL